MANIFTILREKAEEAPLKLFGLFGIINYPLFYFFWKYTSDSRYDDLILRVIATALCLCLFLKDKWPKNIQALLPAYWYITITFCLPFMGTYIFLQNNASSSWVLNVTLALFLMLFVLDWLSFTLVLIFGLLTAVTFYLIQGNQIYIISENLISTILNLLWVMIVALTFSRKHELVEKEKRVALMSSSSAIAHEMRTPLATILMSSDIIKSSAGEIERFICSPSENEKIVLRTEINQIKNLCERLSRITKASQNLINLLLANIKQDFYTLPHTKLSLQTSLDYILDEFAFKPDERVKVHLKVENDFEFYGNLELIMHIFFNLLKNSLYFIRAANKGEIFIHTLQSDRENIVVFKDTGPGIEVHQLAHIFKPFYSKRPHGTGIGLSFCKKAIESMKGKIDVQSDFGVHTTFTLRLPKINAIINKTE